MTPNLVPKGKPSKYKISHQESLINQTSQVIECTDPVWFIHKPSKTTQIMDTRSSGIIIFMLSLRV
jgi:hypothetical protein